MKPTDDLRGVYLARLDARQEDFESHNRLYSRIAWIRLAIAVALGIVVWLIFWQGVLTPWWLLAPPAAFLVLMTVHSRIERRRRQIVQAIGFYQRGLARIEDRWAGTGESGEEYFDEEHLYAADLDIFGRGSIFELLSTGRTKAGEEILAGWLGRPATCGEVVSRQQAVGELHPLLDLREDLATIGPDLRSSIHLEKLADWAGAAPAFNSAWLRPAIRALPVVVIAALAYALVSGWPWAYYSCLLGQGGLLLLLRKQTRSVLSAVELPLRELDLASELIARLEAEEFSSTRLGELRSKFGDGSRRASVQIRRLVGLLERKRALQSADGPLTILILFLTGLVVPVSLVGLSGPRTAVAIEDWRKTYGARVPSWILAIGEFEALMALAGYASEHPADPFPEIVDGRALLEGEELGHPLLPASASVPNSLRLGENQQLIVVSGSNMSGKSTLLRTVGVNTALALAGAPVRGLRLRVSPLAIGATLRIQDSLRTGTSRFYAEITRIRNIMELTSGPLPVLFLLDELLHGTNSHDRATGAEGVVRGLIDRGAIGLATTHDLALARVADRLGDRAINVHFEDRMEGGRMAFDYKMRPGVIEKSNALDLMRAIGLEV